MGNMSRGGDGARRPESAVTDLFSRPATTEDLKALVRALNDSAAEYILIGSSAVPDEARDSAFGGGSRGRSDSCMGGA